MGKYLEYDISNAGLSPDLKDIVDLRPEIEKVHGYITEKNGPGSDFLGWKDIPENAGKGQILEIEKAAKKFNDISDIVVVIGIGGSYLGAKALIEAICTAGQREKVEFAGCDLSGAGLRELFEKLDGKDICINVISKSGTTTEPAIAFRVLESLMVDKYGPKGASERIICTTDANKGALRKMCHEKGYGSFDIPVDVGGRFSVMTPVGLFPAACAGVDIKALLEGAAVQKKEVSSSDIIENPAYLYAALRNKFYRQGKAIEIFSVFEKKLFYACEWWKQLFGESEGKEQKGIFPAGCVFSTDLHSMGQFIQEGARNIFETFLIIKKLDAGMTIPLREDDIDGLNYIAGREVDDVNMTAYEAVASAHCEGGVPNTTIFLKERDPLCLGALFYFFETAVAASAYMLGVNPFNQPGVEAYKKEMFMRLGKPGVC